MKLFFRKTILYYIFLLLLCVTQINLYAQTDSWVSGFDPKRSFPSPEIGTLGTFGLIPANPFTGQANISIPLYEVKYKNLSVPISIEYATKGNKVEDHPGWNGLGWNLSAGGAIYRKVNGWYDEMPLFLGQSIDKSYYGQSGRVPGGYTSSDSLAYYASGNGMELFDGMPDEFVFNFNGYSGIFYITRPTPGGAVELKVRSNGNYRLKAEIVEMDTITFNDWKNELSRYVTRRTANAIYKLKITDEKGVQYIFGGDVDAIEFNNNGIINNAPATDQTVDMYTIASAWHLTQIVDAGGYSIKFSYKRPGRTLTQSVNRNLFGYTAAEVSNVSAIRWLSNGPMLYLNAYTSENISFGIQNPVFLDTITTPSQTIIFSSSKSNDLNYDINRDSAKAKIMTPLQEDEELVSYWQKLDEINVNGIKKFRFNYLADTSRRLQLSSIDLKTPYDKVKAKYTFTYNALKLPRYGMRMADHWGYYNGRSYAYDTNYLATRRPDTAYMRAEMLERITYPTGGYTILQYEPHFYRKVAVHFPSSVDSIAVDSVAGGVRIKRIISIADANSAPVTKEYFYVKNYLTGGNVSSGVLSGRPVYVSTGHQIVNDGSLSSYGFVRVTDYNYQMLSNTNGNHITYSEVTEKSGGGYTVYKYSNLDNGYMDKNPLVDITNFSSIWLEEPVTSMEPYRGLLLEQNVYNGNKELLTKTGYEYNIDTTTAGFKIPWMWSLRYYLNKGTLNPYTIVKMVSGVFYMKPPVPKTITESVYVPGAGLSLTKTTANKYFNDLGTTLSNSYDNYKVAESRMMSSKGDSLTTISSYPYSIIAAGNDNSGIYAGMVNNNINAELVKQVSFRNSIQLKSMNSVYYTPYAGLYLPHYVEEQEGSNKIDTAVYVNSYDNTGNILETVSKGSIIASYIWDYKGQYPIATVMNARLSDIAYTSFEADSTGGWHVVGSPVADITSPSGTYCLNLSGNSSLIFLLSKSGLSSSKTYIVSYWSKGGSYTITGSTAVSSGMTVSGWTYYEHLVKNVTATTITGNGLIDEVRLYPSDAQMTTYIYKQQVGMTSQCDARSIFTYYEYDTYSRLHLIRDLNKNITKLICYNYYTGEIEKCNEAVYYNTAQSDSATRSCSDNQVGSSVIYTVAAGVYSSDESVADANARALAAIAANKQAYANAHGTCSWQSDSMQLSATKQCDAGYQGTSVTYKLSQGAYLSTISQAQADSLAQADLYANYQAYANTHGQCLVCNVFFSKKTASSDLGTFNVNITNASTGASVYNKTLTDPTDAQLASCLSLPTGTGLSYNVSISSMSTIYVTINGTETKVTSTPVVWIMTTGINIVFSSTPATVYSSAAINQSYQKTNCQLDSVGTYVTYPVASGLYTSTISQAYVDSLVQLYSAANGPAYANTNGFCFPAGKNVAVLQKKGAGTVPGTYSITIKKASDNTTALSYSYLALDGNLPLYNTLTSATYIVQITGQQSFKASVNGSEVTVGTSVSSWTVSTPITIIVGAL